MEWVRGETLGHGTFATVSLAKPKKQSTQVPQLIALKSCVFSHSSSLINEKSVLDDLSDCPHIIRCFGSNISFEKNEKLFNLSLEYALGGSLSDKIRRSVDRKIPEYEFRRLTKSILKGIFYIHKKGYVHCDLKPQNILLCSDGKNETTKIGDFGLAKKAEFKRGREKVELRGTPMYMSPEMANSGEQEAPADIWAFGCLLAEMAAGAPAWRFPASADVAQLLLRIGNSDEIPEIPKELSSEGRDFIKNCFVRDPKERWTAKMLLDHPFISDFNDDNEIISILPENCLSEGFSSSPKCPFDFLDWDELSCEITNSPSWGFDSSSLAIDRLSGLEYDRAPDWSVTDSWVTVR